MNEIAMSLTEKEIINLRKLVAVWLFVALAGITVVSHSTGNDKVNLDDAKFEACVTG